MIELVLGEVVKVYFNINTLDNKPALDKEGQQPELIINNNGWTTNGISTLISLGYGNYYANMETNLLPLAKGDIIQTRFISPTTLYSNGQVFVVGNVPPDPLAITYYGTITEAELFFSRKLNNEPWVQATNERKIAALTEATQLIDRLAFIDEKKDETQPLEFPRKDLGLPEAIKFATWHIAILLLDGYDPEIEAEKLMTEMNKYQSVQTYYERSFIPDYKTAGIPSAIAWSYLKPYLRDHQLVEMYKS